MPVILVTNDDGITAPGLRTLVESVAHLGKVVVVAPDSPHSGMGHAITISKPLRLSPTHVFDDLGINSWQCSGTPVDCVKLAHDVILDALPDLVVSGINHGSNASINVIYSGTMSAAVEAAIEDIPAIGFSLQDYRYEADFEPCRPFVTHLSQWVLEHGLAPGTLLNVNIPKIPKEEIKGIKVCRQARSKWDEEFEERIDPHGRKYYWLTGKFINMDSGDDTDEWALTHGYVSVVPVQFDLTAHKSLAQLGQDLTPTYVHSKRP